MIIIITIIIIIIIITTSSYKVLSSQISSKTPRHHSIPYGHLLNLDFLRIYLTSQFVTSTIPSLLEKTW